jgi:hypothetical protein
MYYIEAPSYSAPPLIPKPWVFLGGGITDCPDWQQEVRARLEGEHLTLLNPRRANFPIDDPNAAEGQIKWEFEMFDRCHGIIFWFPCETLCPIVLYELGKWTARTKSQAAWTNSYPKDKPLFIGAHPDYARRQDVIIQTRLELPDQVIHDSVAGVADEVRTWARQQ